MTDEDLVEVYTEAVRRDGSGEDSRAAVVWSQLKEKIAMLESGVFVRGGTP